MMLFKRSFGLTRSLFLEGVEFHVLLRVLLCLIFSSRFFVLSCRILDSASLFIFYVHKHDRLGFGMLTVAVFDYIC